MQRRLTPVALTQRHIDKAAAAHTPVVLRAGVSYRGGDLKLPHGTVIVFGPGASLTWG